MQLAFFKSDMDMSWFAHSRGKSFLLDSSTSVAKQKAHFLETLAQLGKVVSLDDAISRDDYAAICAREDTIVATVHRPSLWGAVPRRLLAHSLGDFMLLLGYFDIERFAPNTINLVTTAFQADRVKKYLGQAAPKTAVFTPCLDKDNSYRPSRSQKAAVRKKAGLTDRDIHIVYAGRWLATKGICQLVRALNLWALGKVTVSLAGNFEPGFRLNQSGASHLAFSHFFAREVVGRNRQVRLRLLKARSPAALREFFWSADLFVYASVHEDENFGMAPREAMLCGVPVVVSDFCGLGALGRGLGLGLLTTYPTLTGPRYGLRRLRVLIARALAQKRQDFDKGLRFVMDECDISLARQNLNKAAQELLKKPLEKKLPEADARRALVSKLLAHADSGILQSFLGKNRPIPEGIVPEGSGFYSKEFLYHKFIATIQKFYTTLEEPPQVITGAPLRGFFRLALWEQEKALVEFGFPGPRLKRYDEKSWRHLVAAFREEGSGEIVMRPRGPTEVDLARELVEAGFLVPDTATYE